MKSIELCVARFDEDTKASFMDLYTKIDAGIDVGNADDNNVEEETDDFRILSENDNQLKFARKLFTG